MKLLNWIKAKIYYRSIRRCVFYTNTYGYIRVVHVRAFNNWVFELGHFNKDIGYWLDGASNYRFRTSDQDIRLFVQEMKRLGTEYTC